jgi:hypothetical protein
MMLHPINQLGRLVESNKVLVKLGGDYVAQAGVAITVTLTLKKVAESS